MAGPASPESEGPTFGPPSLPSGWIAQWDGASRKYYFVQLSTGYSQWETPTEAAPVGGTPMHGPEEAGGGLITHPDGSQTVRYADGTMEPVLPREDGSATRGGPGAGEGQRGIGSFLQNQLLSNLGGKSHTSGGGLNNGGLGGLLSGFSGDGHSGGGGGIGGKLASQLAHNLFSSGNNKPSAPTNYHGGQQPGAAPQHHGGLAGSLMGGVSSFLSGAGAGSNQNFGYSNMGHSGPYSGAEPPVSYQKWAETQGGISSGTASSAPPLSQHLPSYAPPPGAQQHYGAPPPPYGQAQHHGAWSGARGPYSPYAPQQGHGQHQAYQTLGGYGGGNPPY